SLSPRSVRSAPSPPANPSATTSPPSSSSSSASTRPSPVTADRAGRTLGPCQYVFQHIYWQNVTRPPRRDPAGQAVQQPRAGGVPEHRANVGRAGALVLGGAQAVRDHADAVQRASDPAWGG